MYVTLAGGTSVRTGTHSHISLMNVEMVARISKRRRAWGVSVEPQEHR